VREADRTGGTILSGLRRTSGILSGLRQDNLRVRGPWWRLSEHQKRIKHKVYIQVLRSMSSEQRLMKALELSEFTRRLFRQGLKERFPGLSEEQFHQRYLQRLEKCHNRNY